MALLLESPLGVLILYFISKTNLFDIFTEFESKRVGDSPLRCGCRQRARETFVCHLGIAQAGALGGALAGAGDIVDPARPEQKWVGLKGTNPNRGSKSSDVVSLHCLISFSAIAMVILKTETSTYERDV